MERIFQFLAETPCFYLATVDDGKPRVRPFGFHMRHKDRLYFGMGTHKASYKQILANPNVEICTANAKGQWIRIKGTAVLDQNEETTAQAFVTRPSLKQIYNSESGLTMATFYLENGEAEITDMKGNFEKFNL